MTTPLFLLRCCEVGISVRDLDLFTIGLVLDIWTEKSNDGVNYTSYFKEVWEYWDYIKACTC